MVEGLTVEDIWEGDVKGVKVNGAKYRSRSLGQGTCGVRTLRRSTMQGLMVVGLIVEEILNVDVKCVKSTAAQNIGQGHWVKIPAKSRRSTMQGLVARVLHLRRSGMLK